MVREKEGQRQAEWIPNLLELFMGPWKGWLDCRLVCTFYLDRRRDAIMDEDGVRAKFGVSPASIPDYLGLVGDSADGIPGIPRWGAKSTGQVLDQYGHIEQIPPDAADWAITVRGALALAASLADNRESALLYRQLAALRLDVPIAEDLADLEWQGAHQQLYQDLCDELGFGRLREGVGRWSGG